MNGDTARGGDTGAYLHHPTIAGDLVVFVCEDDLWTVPAEGGAARRLTAGTTPCAGPRLSPDGRLVAFTGKPEGVPEICLFSVAEGGPVRRLTARAAARCTPVGWHPETGEVLYSGTADRPAAFGERVFAVHPDGGPPRLVEAGPAVTLSHGPEGAVLIGRSLTDPARRKRYRGGAAGELWVDPDGGGFRRLRPDAANPADPCWAG
ncbi:peptidase, partial [Streptomyces alkaliphilus]|nr:peptidase [Streptomyces alkaliphilus]